MVDRVTPKVTVDWLNNGSFTDLYDDITHDVAADPGLTIEQGMDASQTLRPPMIDAADFEVFNHTAKYSQENAAGPLYQLIVPGRPVQLYGSWGTKSTYREHTAYREHDAYRGLVPYALLTGLLADLSMTTELGNRRVHFSAVGSLSKLHGVTISIPMQANIRTGDALNLILDAVGWPASKRVIATGDTPLVFWWLDERDAYDAAVELVNSEGPGQLYEDGSGAIHFESRGYRSTTPRSQTSQATFFDQQSGAKDAYRTHNAYRWRDPYRGRTSGLWFTQLSYDPSFRNIVNRATYTCRRRTVMPLAKVWEYGRTLTLGGGASTTIIARPNDPFVAAVAPVAGTDYTVTSGSATVSLTYSSGAVAFIYIVAGGSGCTIGGASGSNGLQLRAQTLALTSESIAQNSVDASDSIAKFGERTLEINGWPEIDPSDAEAVCNAHVTRRLTQRPLVTMTLRDADNAHIEQMLRRTVSDRVTIVDGASGLHADCWLETKSLAITTGQAMTTSFICEKVAEVAGVVWDGATALWDTSLWAD